MSIGIPEAGELDIGPVVTMDEMFEARNKIRDAIQPIALGNIDSGMGLGGADLWATIGGVEYFIHIEAKRRLHNA